MEAVDAWQKSQNYAKACACKPGLSAEQKANYLEAADEAESHINFYNRR